MKNSIYNVTLKGIFIVLASCFHAGCNTSSVTTTKSPDRPNILFIISDDLSAEVLGAYGSDQCKTPNIDQLAQQGAMFTRVYSQFPVCGPSRAALLAGLYPEKLGIMSNGHSSKFEMSMGRNPSLPEHFRKNGYITYRLGKIFHMRVPGDITAGVDGPDHAASWNFKYNFKGLEWMSSGTHEHLSNENLKFHKDKHYNLGFGTAFYSIQLNDEGADQPDHKATTKAIELLQAFNPEEDRPFFMAVGYIRPHVPLVSPVANYETHNTADLRLSESVQDDQNDIPNMGITRTSLSFGITAEMKQKKVLQAYYASVAFMDRQVGRLIEILEQQNLAENTIVVFTSDHGYHLGEHDLWQKLSLHEESTRIPLIIKGPGIKNQKCDALSEQIDIYPTLCELAGLNQPAHLQGYSLQPIMNAQKQAIREAAYSVTSKGAMIRTKDWAYIEYIDGTSELYDMNQDVQQFYNLADDPTYQNVHLDLKQKLNNQRKKALRSP